MMIDTPSQPNYKDTTVFALLLLLIMATLYGNMVGTIGFISDDWSLIHRATTAPFWLPAEQHHYSLIINLLFKGVALGFINAAIFHLLAFAFHAINTFIVYFLCRDLFHVKNAKFIAALFAMSPAGMEAITWCCAIGYVLCAFWILLGIYVFWKKGDHPLTRSHAYLLAALQLGAFLCWDWGLVLAPALFIQCFLSLTSPYKDFSAVKRLKSLWPVFLMWLALVILKRSIGQDFGYAINSPLQMVSNFVSAPLLSILPQFTKGFYSSPIGMISALSLFLALVWTAWRNAAACAMLLLLFVWLLPLVLLGYPQSRYFYLLDFPVYYLSIQFLNEIINLVSANRYKNFLKKVSTMGWIGLLCAYFLWSNQRISWWKGASEQAQSIYEQIEAAAASETKPLVVVNMPDRYGPKEMIWLPYLWRCGIVHFKTSFHQAYTIDCIHPPSDIHAIAMPPEIISKQYLQHAIYEVVTTKQANQDILSLVKKNPFEQK